MRVKALGLDLFQNLGVECGGTWDWADGAKEGVAVVLIAVKGVLTAIGVAHDSRGSQSSSDRA